MSSNGHSVKSLAELVAKYGTPPQPRKYPIVRHVVTGQLVPLPGDDDGFRRKPAPSAGLHIEYETFYAFISDEVLAANGYARRNWRRKP